MPDLTRGHTFSSGEEVDHTKLNNLVGNATINNLAVDEAQLAASAVTNAKVSASAAIALSKLADSSSGQVIVGSSAGVQTAVSMTGDVTITDAGVTSIGTGKVTAGMMVTGVVQNIPVGSLVAYAGTSAPTGWLICDGTEKNSVSDTTLADLYTAIGTRYGGSGAAAFNLPDMRGRVAVGADGSAARMASNDAAGESGGTELHTLTVAEMPAHTHDVNTGTANNNQSGVAGNAPKGSDEGSPTVSGYTDGAVTKGGGGSHNNMQPYQVVDNYIIKT